MSNPSHLLALPLEPDERVLLSVRRHWITFWPSFIALLVAAALPAGFAIGLLSRAGVASPLAWRISLATAALWVGFFLARAVLVRRRHQRTGHVITDRRVVSVYVAGALGVETSSTALADIVEVRTRMHGIAAALLRFGDLEFFTAEGGAPRTIRDLATPQQVALLLQQACRVARAARFPSAKKDQPGLTRKLDR